MIERYTKPEMGHLWSIENEWQQILNVEMAACDAMAELGEIPKEAAKNIRAKQNSMSIASMRSSRSRITTSSRS